MEINYLSENIKLYDLSKGLKKTVFMESEHVVSDSRADVAAVLKANAHVTEDEVVKTQGQNEHYRLLEKCQWKSVQCATNNGHQ